MIVLCDFEGLIRLKLIGKLSEMHSAAAIGKTLSLCFFQHSWRPLIPANYTLMVNVLFTLFAS